MLILTLLHPVESTPVQSWSFEEESVIRIGRAVDNHVVLYSAVVSRYHVELRQSSSQWEVVNLGTNGTYLNDERVHQATLEDGSIIRLARSGPNLQIRIDVDKEIDTDKELASPPREMEELDNSNASSSSSQHPTISPVFPESLDQDPKSASPSFPLGISTVIEGFAPFHVFGQHALPARQRQEQAVSLLSRPHEQEEDLLGLQCQCQQWPIPKDNEWVCNICGLPFTRGETIGNYQILKPLGTRSNTWVAWRDGNIVVLKTLSQSDLNRPETVALFKEQAHALCQLSHPGMPKIYEAFELEDKIFLISEMINGQNLKQWVQEQGPVPLSLVKAWAIEICQVLDYLHQQISPVVHGDLKPTNLIRPTIPHGFNQLVLVDFCDIGILIPDMGIFADNCAYTAPEQQLGKPSPASDLFSLGSTLVYLLTGQEPDTFYRLADQEFCLYVDDVPGLNPDMAQIIQKLTYPKPEQRYTSAQDVIEALQRLL